MATTYMNVLGFAWAIADCWGGVGYGTRPKMGTNLAPIIFSNLVMGMCKHTKIWLFVCLHHH